MTLCTQFTHSKPRRALYSYRMMGKKLGLDTSQVFRILSKEYHLPTRCVPLAKELLGLSGRSGELFEILVAAARTKSSAEKKKLIDMALALRDVKLYSVEDHEQKFLSEWWIPVVRSWVELNGGIVNPEEIASKIVPPISPDQVVEAMHVLTELGFVIRQSSGRYKVNNVHFTVTGSEKKKSIRNYQKQVLGLSADALDVIPTSERNISSLLVSVDEECFQDLQEMSQEFRRQIQKRVEEVPVANTTMQIIVSIFPVTKQKGGI